jgi:DNA-binding SARP family transcriptional activator
MQSVLAQPKRTALLVYLTLARPRGMHQRDVLLNLFWGERDEQGARKALRQALYYLRSSLGDDAIASIGDTEVGVTRSEITCDAVAFVDALQEGRFEDACALYTGELMPGFHLADAPEFEQWLDEERSWLRNQAAHAAWQLAAAREAAGDQADAVRWARRAAAMSPADETMVRRLMTSLERVGDRAAALRAYDEFAGTLQREYELEPSAETVALANALRTAAPTLATETIIPAASPPVVMRATTQIERRVSAADTVPSRVRVRRRYLAAVLTAGIVVYTTIAVAFSEPCLSDPDEIVVTPFAVVGEDTALARLASSIPLMLSARLDGDPRPRATDYATLIGALGSTDPRARPLSRRRAAALACEVRAASALKGVIGRTSDGITMTGELIDADSRNVSARAAAHGGIQNADSLVYDLVATLLARAAGVPEERIPFLRRVPLEAVLWYLDGLAMHHSFRHLPGVEAFRHALGHDSTFATAALEAALAASYGGGEGQVVTDLNRLAWRWQQYLAPFDRDLVNARVGPRALLSTNAEKLTAWEKIAHNANPRAQEYASLNGYADFLFHYGFQLGIRDAHELARKALHRADDVTPDRTPLHLSDLAFLQRDTSSLRVNNERMLSQQPHDTIVAVLRWMDAAARGDTAVAAQIARQHSLDAIYNLPQYAGYALDDAERTTLKRREQASTQQKAYEDLRRHFNLVANRGQPLRAHAMLDTIYTMIADAPQLRAFGPVMDRVALRMVLYGDGDRTRIGAQLARLTTRAASPLPAAGEEERAEWYLDRCVIEEWRLSRGETATVDAAIAALARGNTRAQLCAQVLTAFAATVRGDPRAAPLLDSLDVLSRNGPPEWQSLSNHVNLIIARLFERQERFPQARAAIARRGIYYIRFNDYIATYTHEEGRLALAVGDTAGAVKAWRVYVGLHEKAEPGLQPRRAQVLRTLETLTQPDRAGRVRR